MMSSVAGGSAMMMVSKAPEPLSHAHKMMAVRQGAMISHDSLLSMLALGICQGSFCGIRNEQGHLTVPVIGKKRDRKLRIVGEDVRGVQPKYQPMIEKKKHREAFFLTKHENLMY
jgi:hypothetical protein